jgi:hypothetical protein
MAADGTREVKSARTFTSRMSAQLSHHRVLVRIGKSGVRTSGLGICNDLNFHFDANLFATARSHAHYVEGIAARQRTRGFKRVCVEIISR